MYKLLIVEDEKLIRDNLKALIDFNHFNLSLVGEARNGLEALALIEEKEPDLILLDLNLPVLDGLEVLRQTISRFSYQVIIISGYADFEFAKEAINFKVVNYLLKPIDEIELKKSIERALMMLENKEEEVANPNYHHYTNQALQYIKANYNKPIRLDDIASSLAISKDYLNKIFKQDTNTTVRQALIAYRLKKATELLNRSELRVYEIASLVGFNEYKYFHQVFKRYYGTSPNQYRINLQQKEN